MNNCDLLHHDIGKFIKSWIQGVIHTFPRELVNKINNTNSYYKLLMFNINITNHTCKEMYILSLDGTQNYNVNGIKYIANKGDIIYIPKNTYYNIIPFNKSNIILTVN